MKTTLHDPLELAVIGKGLGCPEGPVICADGSVLCVDIDSGRILRIADGVVSTVAKPGGGPNGLAIGPDGLGYVANNGGFLWTEVGGLRIPMDLATHTNEPPNFAGGWIEHVDLTTGEVTVLARSCGTKRLTGPNDLVFDEVGGLWFTDHGKLRATNVDRGGLYYLPPGGEVREVAYPLLGPNGVGLSPDCGRVYIAETMTGRVWAWDLVGPGEVNSAGVSLAVPHGGTCIAATPFTLDSLAVEEDGRIVIGGIGDGLVVVTPDGQEVDVYPIPGDVTTNIAFGGADRRRAVITLSGSGRLAETTWPRPGLQLQTA
ncbi:MAG: SMP-30/gluconolactonase/LRE family protein [Sciscionella sp.]